MGKARIGLVLMASVTSLPEWITGISSVAIVKASHLAAGDIFGSCVFNLLILSVLDYRIKMPLFSVVKSSHNAAAISGIILLTVAGSAIFLSGEATAVFGSAVLPYSSLLFISFRLGELFKCEHAALIDSPEGQSPASGAL